MIAIDTNVVVRFLVADDLDQFQIAKRLIQSERIFVPSSVLLETEWVLRDGYEFSKSDALAALRDLLNLENVVAEDRATAMQALAWGSAGMDFADALHLAASKSCVALASFDLEFAKVARRLGATPVRAP
jgi:predicted nucleic-acid-binding protein